MTNQERADYANLLMLCPTHHEQADGANGRSLYAPADLTRIKRQHEDRFRRVLAHLAESQHEYTDLTRRNRVKPCLNLARFLAGSGLDDDELAEHITLLNQFADELRRVTLAARGLLSTVVEFGGRIGVPEASRRAETTEERIRQLVVELHRFKLLGIDYEDKEISQRLDLWVGARGGGALDGWPFWDELRTYIRERGDFTFDDVIVRLDFSLLD